MADTATAEQQPSSIFRKSTPWPAREIERNYATDYNPEPSSKLNIILWIHKYACFSRLVLLRFYIPLELLILSLTLLPTHSARHQDNARTDGTAKKIAFARCELCCASTHTHRAPVALSHRFNLRLGCCTFSTEIAMQFCLLCIMK